MCSDFSLNTVPNTGGVCCRGRQKNKCRGRACCRGRLQTRNVTDVEGLGVESLGVALVRSGHPVHLLL